jgi:hypothetical protein
MAEEKEKPKPRKPIADLTGINTSATKAPHSANKDTRDRDKDNYSKNNAYLPPFPVAFHPPPFPFPPPSTLSKFPAPFPFPFPAPHVPPAAVENHPSSNREDIPTNTRPSRSTVEERVGVDLLRITPFVRPSYWGSMSEFDKKNLEIQWEIRQQTLQLKGRMYESSAAEADYLIATVELEAARREVNRIVKEKAALGNIFGVNPNEGQ